MIVKCPKCDQEFENQPKTWTKKFCSRVCANGREWSEEKRIKLSNKMFERHGLKPRRKICLFCQRLCKTKRRFCDKTCMTKYREATSPKVPRQCLQCGGVLASQNKLVKCCSQECANEFKFNEYIRQWKSGKISGLAAGGVVTPPVKKYLRLKYGDKCCLCGWNSVNPHTKKVPLVADHINGEWQDNTESNLRLICPNCDSLSATYGGANRGKGRKSIRKQTLLTL